MSRPRVRRLPLLIVPLALLALVVARPALAETQTIYVVNRTAGAVRTSTLRDYLPAFQHSIADFRRWWGGPDVQLVLADSAPNGAWKLSLARGGLFDPGGFHWVDPYGAPYARVYVGNGSWTVSFSHELFEMLADPYITRTVQADRLYLIEVADPVEADAYAYIRRSASGRRVKISDFVGPDWYGGGLYFDFRHYVKQAHQLLPGGYVSYWDGFDWVSLGP